MVVRRPQKDSEESTGTDKPELELMERLVKKSLDVNPSLKAGRDTRGALEALRQQAVARSKQSPGESGGTSGAAEPGSDLSSRRQSAIAFFLDQKASEFQGQIDDIIARERALEAERAHLRERVLDEVADFFGLMSGGADSPEAHHVLRDHLAFLKSLGVSESDIVTRARRRAGR